MDVISFLRCFMKTVIEVLSMYGNDVNINLSSSICWFDMMLSGQQVFTKEEMTYLFKKQVQENLVFSDEQWMCDKDVDNCMRSLDLFLKDYDDTVMSLWFVVDEDNVYCLKINQRCNIVTYDKELLELLTENNIDFSVSNDYVTIIGTDNKMSFVLRQFNEDKVVTHLKYNDGMSMYINNVLMHVAINDFLISET